MRLSTLIAGSLASLALPFAAVAHAHGHGRRHNDVAHRARGDVSHHLYKRFDGIRYTWYDVGLGACGQYNQPGDFIVALSAINWGDGYPGPNCFKSITISANGKTAQATIMDECMGCPDHGLDFSKGLFEYFASLDAGVITGSWWFNDGSDNGGGQQVTTTKTTKTKTPTPTPTTTWTPEPEPTTTWSPEPTPTTTSHTTTSTSSTPPPPPSTTSTSSYVAPTTSKASSSPPPSSSATPTSSSVAPTPTGPNALNAVNQAVLGLAAIAVVGGQ
ncbi:hypothetical protein QCA50_002835 [Cerrena zonata]|uniref:Uncharacterized protein n=1 Tax=Cerrena zonata TaxID=2478898 RepID=A0AAW0GHX4_9APHY